MTSPRFLASFPDNDQGLAAATNLASDFSSTRSVAVYVFKHTNPAPETGATVPLRRLRVASEEDVPDNTTWGDMLMKFAHGRQVWVAPSHF